MHGFCGFNMDVFAAFYMLMFLISSQTVVHVPLVVLQITHSGMSDDSGNSCRESEQLKWHITFCYWGILITTKNLFKQEIAL